jgi:hypothetical protein
MSSNVCGVIDLMAFYNKTMWIDLGLQMREISTQLGDAFTPFLAIRFYFEVDFIVRFSLFDLEDDNTVLGEA